MTGQAELPMGSPETEGDQDREESLLLGLQLPSEEDDIFFADFILGGEWCGWQ